MEKPRHHFKGSKATLKKDHRTKKGKLDQVTIKRMCMIGTGLPVVGRSAVSFSGRWPRTGEFPLRQLPPSA
jgi:hypothetical protein